jgi:(p)ppGpp synthase/HD superfamily hydrolase
MDQNQTEEIKIKTFDPNDRKELLTTLDFAYKAHRGQYRKGSGLPFIVHPLAVLSQISEWGITRLVIWKTALCHDVREECRKVTAAHLIEVIGAEAAGYVEELSFFPDRTLAIPVPEQKAAYMASFHNKSVPALVVKVADRICNTFDFLSTDPEYAKVYWKKAARLIDAMRQRADEINQYFEDESLAGHMRYTASSLAQMMQ